MTAELKLSLDNTLNEVLKPDRGLYVHNYSMLTTNTYI
jgi:hypothetical protein